MGTDIHPTHPTDCTSCAILPANWGCLSHTCPDCGAIVFNETNERGELTHDCCKVCVETGANRPHAFVPQHFASPRCQSGGRNHCTCDICF